MVIILALCIPVTAFVTGYFTLRGVKVGLELHQPKQIVKEPEPIVVKEEKKPPQTPPIINEILNEWINGAEER